MLPEWVGLPCRTMVAGLPGMTPRIGHVAQGGPLREHHCGGRMFP